MAITVGNIVNINASHLGGSADLRLFAGNNSMGITARSSMAALRAVTGGGNDELNIDDSSVFVAVYIRLGAGADRLFVRNVDPATEWPSTLLGLVDINGEAGVDTTNVSALPLGALRFESFVP